MQINKSIYKIGKKTRGEFYSRSWPIFNDIWNYNYLSLVSGWEQIENGFVYGSLDSFYQPQVKTSCFFLFFWKILERVVKSIEKCFNVDERVYALAVWIFIILKPGNLAINLWKNFQMKKQIGFEIFETCANFLKNEIKLFTRLRINMFIV